MASALETAHQTIKAGPGIPSAAATMGLQPSLLSELLMGRRPMTPQFAAKIAGVTGQRVHTLEVADADVQLLFNRNTAL